MMIARKALPRRTVLRGMGAALALPLLDGMVPALTALAKTPARAPARFCTVYVPNGIIMEQWTPADEGGRLDLTPTLQPLAAHRDRLLLLSGLDNTGASARTGASGAHAKPAGAFLTGVEPLRTTSSSSLQLGTSMDQIAANAIGQETTLPSLELGLEGTDTVNGVGTCDVGFSCAYQNRLAWSSPTTPLPVEANPRVVFERLFGAVDSTDPKMRAARLRRQRSIIDSVLDKVHDLSGELGRGDRRKLGEYVDSVREIERRIQNAEARGQEIPVVESPAGIPVSYDEHARLMFDMQALAFQTDATRIITFQIGREQSGATYPQIGVSDSHHPISHHGGDKNKMAALQRINTYHISLFGYFLDRLAETTDGDGSVLDHIAILYGSAISDGNRHDIHNLPILLAGGAGGRIRGGRHVRYAEGTQRLTNLQLTLLNALGVPAEEFGDSTGERLHELAGVAGAPTV